MTFSLLKKWDHYSMLEDWRIKGKNQRISVFFEDLTVPNPCIIVPFEILEI